MPQRATVFPSEVHEVEVMSPEIRFNDAPQWLTREAQDHLRHVLHLHNESASCWKRGAIGMVLCGVELHTIKKMVGHGNFEEVRIRYIEKMGISRRTTLRYMALADAARKLLLRSRGQGGATDAMRLLGEGAGSDCPEYQIVLTAVYNCATGKDWIDLMEEMQLARPTGRGGFHPPREYLERFAKLRKLDAGHYLDWEEEVREDFRSWFKEEKRREGLAAAHADPAHHDKLRRAAAEKHWKPFITQALIGVKGKDTWSHLPKDTKQELAETLKKLAELIEGTI